MKILFLCGVFEKSCEKEVSKHARRPIEYSANLFQQKLIRGFEAITENFEVITAPFIGSYPNASDIITFRGFSNEEIKYKYVAFNNVWGVRNFSRAFSLKQALCHFIKDEDHDKQIILYSPHTPFLEAAVYAKKKDPSIKICMIVPDLPQYMNLDEKVSLIYKVGKRYDICKFNKLNKYVDSYVLLTEAMADKLEVGNRPYIVVEGIVDEDIFEKNEKQKRELKKAPCTEKYIVYTGKMNRKFGVQNLVDAFCQMDDPNYRLILCGCGDADNYIAEKAKQDSRIIALGQVTPDVAHEWVLKADVLVNPRENNEEYTKYSFPSKNIEYLASGNPVVAYMLDGMGDCYREYIYLLENLSNNTKTLIDMLEYALQSNTSERDDRSNSFKKYARRNLEAKQIASRLCHLYVSVGDGE